MAADPNEHRSRRALLAAAAGGAAALAASAAMPLTTMAHDTDDLQKGVDNQTTSTTSVSNTQGDSTFGFQGTSTGVFGYSPSGLADGGVGAGVWGESPDIGVFGNGTVGVNGFGAFGVLGSSDDPTGAGVQAFGATDSDTALDVHGKVKFNRSGRATVAKNKSSVKVSLPGVTTGSRVFAVCFTNRSGRWVRAATPTTGSFTIYLNATVSATTYVSWWVLN